jgi:menaquinone-dependent protoporphyrinogen IX oxidase
MSVLIAYASKHGATAGIAERIGAAMDLYRLDARLAPISDVHNPIECAQRSSAARCICGCGRG